MMVHGAVKSKMEENQIHQIKINNIQNVKCADFPYFSK